MKIKLEYNGKPDMAMDNKIIKALKKIGVMFYAEGYDLNKKIRDIAFDYVPYVPMRGIKKPLIKDDTI